MQVGEHCKVLIHNDHQLVAYFENPRVRGSIPRLATRIFNGLAERLGHFLFWDVTET